METTIHGARSALTVGLDGAALEAAAKKLRRLRLTDVGGRKEAPCATVKSVLQRGLGGLYDDEAVTYILRHGLKYYLEALPPNVVIEGNDAALSRRVRSNGELGVERPGKD